MSRLPGWVQVVDATVRLYVDDSSDAFASQHPTRDTFLRVLGGGTSRLQVDAYDETGAQGLRGWIDADYVQKHVGDLAKNADLSRFIL